MASVVTSRSGLQVWNGFSVVVYDKKDPEKGSWTVALEKGEKGTWKQTLDANSGLRYQQLHWLILLPDRVDKTNPSFLTYAKSLAAWNEVT